MTHVWEEESLPVWKLCLSERLVCLEGLLVWKVCLLTWKACLLTFRGTLCLKRYQVCHVSVEIQVQKLYLEILVWTFQLDISFEHCVWNFVWKIRLEISFGNLFGNFVWKISFGNFVWKTDRPTDQPTDRPTDITPYKDAFRRLKSLYQVHSSCIKYCISLFNV